VRLANRGNDFLTFTKYGKLQRSYSFSKSTTEVFTVQGAWYSLNTIPTMVHSQSFRIITYNPTSIAPLFILRPEQLCRIEPCEPSPVLGKGYRCCLNIIQDDIRTYIYSRVNLIMIHVHCFDNMTYEYQ
jgi:hypothetical protein